MPLNSKRKGNKGENEFANWLQENGIKAYRNSASGATTAKGDINNSMDLTIEVKTAKHINLKKCWQQVKRDSELASNTPLLAIHLDGMADKKWLIVQDCDNWLEAIKSKKVEVKSGVDKWKLIHLKEAINKVLRDL